MCIYQKGDILKIDVFVLVFGPGSKEILKPICLIFGMKTVTVDSQS